MYIEPTGSGCSRPYSASIRVTEGHALGRRFLVSEFDPKVTKNCLVSRVGPTRTGIGVVFN